jgi:hypothetical protein
MDNAGAGHGFYFAGATDVSLADCMATGTVRGLYINGTCARVTVSGGSYTANTYSGVECYDAAMAQTTHISSETDLTGNTTNGYFVAVTALGYGSDGTQHIRTDNTTWGVPAIAATTVEVANGFPFTVGVHISGGTYTDVSVKSSAGTACSLGPASYCEVEPGGTIAITYSSAPTWVWRRA